MKKQHVELINYLCNQKKEVTSKALAIHMGISIRSVKSYISEINISAASRIIFSSNTGYTINKEHALTFLNENKKYLPQTSDDRSIYIIKQLLMEHSSFLDLYDLCDTLYVSYSTIKADISKMNKAYANFHVSFVCEKDCLHIVGSEKDKRKLVSYIMYEETNNQFMDSTIIKDSFKNLPIESISSIILNTFKKYNYYINDFAYINLLLHFAIMIDRIKDGNFVNNDTDEALTIESDNERSLIQELCHCFATDFDIHFTSNEQIEIYMLFKTNANYSMPSNRSTLTKVVGEDLFIFAQEIVDKILDSYYVDLHNESFLSPFSLHLKNLILRAKTGKYAKNPMTTSIKNSCPTIYDMAIFISIQLFHKYHVHINEDEITFLALHIGAEIERQKTNDKKIKVILLCPDYLEMASQIYNQLLTDFGNHIDIIKTVSYEHAIDCTSDMIITTIELQRKYRRDVLLISPLISQIDHGYIFGVLNRIKKNKKYYILRKNFETFFNPSLFYILNNQTNKNEVIHLLASTMVEQEYVLSDFEQKVHIRENAASTAFHTIAIPHSMDMDALQTCISVAISEQGVLWGAQKVNLVLLVAINKADKKLFYELYDALVELFSDDSLIDLIKHCPTFTKLKEVILNYIQTITE